MYSWLFGKLSGLTKVTLDLDSTVVTRNGSQEGAGRGYNPARRGRASHHPLLAFIAEARLVANFWFRPGDTHSANNVLQFLESTLAHLADKTVGLLRADSGFFDNAFMSALENKGIAYIVAAKLTTPLQRAIYQSATWWALKPGIEIAEIMYQAHGWVAVRRIIVIRQSTKDAPGVNGNIKAYQFRDLKSVPVPGKVDFNQGMLKSWSHLLSGKVAWQRRDLEVCSCAP
ncbi:MAG: transposase [Desulfuromonadales bacterium]|nr:transposase [Desulfuromonadales bacterium]